MQSSNQSNLSKSRIFSKAWAFIKDGIYTSLSEALKASWKYFKLRAALLIGDVRFSYKKVDGTIREAFGTLRADSINYTPKGNSKTNSVNNCKYWDIEKGGYRSFKISNLI